jgi:malate dehydrogenase (oxaloacetate-decarboxylating)(NADP+)
VNGAGAAAIACSRLYESLGARHENFIMFDRKGVLHKQRADIDELKLQYANAKGEMTLAEAMKDADVFIGLSVGNCVTPEMVKGMARNPIVFAMANPDPEISWEDATSARKDVIMATGRSDYPNQVNNVLGFPYIFRGALDVRASQINESMKLAAVKALATVAPAVAKAAMDSGVAQHPIGSWDTYITGLNKRLGLDNQVMRVIGNKARRDPKRIVFAEADNAKILKAAQIVFDEGIGYPILLGDEV